MTRGYGLLLGMEKPPGHPAGLDKLSGVDLNSPSYPSAHRASLPLSRARALAAD